MRALAWWAGGRALGSACTGASPTDASVGPRAPETAARARTNGSDGEDARATGDEGRAIAARGRERALGDDARGRCAMRCAMGRTASV